MSMGYVDKLNGTNISCMEEICRNKKNIVSADQYGTNLCMFFLAMES